MRRVTLIALVLILYTSMNAQEYKRNNNWCLGFNPVLRFNFNSNITIDTFAISLSATRISSTISDTNGTLQFYCNGYGIVDMDGDLMQNGDTINSPYGSVLYAHLGGGGLADQTSIILPKKGNTYFVFSTGMSDSAASNYINFIYTEFDVLNYSVVDMDSNAGKGKVVEKNVVLADKQHYYYTDMQAVKHANGKDWWLVKSDCRNNRYQEFLVKEDTIMGPYYQQATDFLSNAVCGAWSQLYFNEQGTKMAGSMYATLKNGNFYDYNRVDIYDFDRCNGKLTFKKYYETPFDTSSYPNWDIKDGICFSPNGKLLYMSNTYTIYQIDLEDTNTNNATFIHGPDTTIANFPWYNTMGIAPNGKLYIGNWNGTRKYMSYIDSPNVKGLGCGFVPQGVWQQYTNLMSPPNMPNYGLGADTTVVCWPLQSENVKEKEKDWVVYPNPTYQNIYIKNARGKKKTLYNLSGQIISSTTKDEIDVSKYAKGMYFIQINNAVKKIIIE